MKIAEVLLQDFDVEISNARRTLERLPEDKADYVPHAKSMPLGRLAMHVATLPLFGSYIIEDEAMDMAAPTRPRTDLTFTTLQECLRQLDASAARCRELLLNAPDEALTANWRFSFGAHVIADDARSRIFRLMFFDHMIHHVAQLGVYLRMNDLPVPGLYGPSADEPWAPK